MMSILLIIIVIVLIYCLETEKKRNDKLESENYNLKKRIIEIEKNDDNSNLKDTAMYNSEHSEVRIKESNSESKYNQKDKSYTTSVRSNTSEELNRKKERAKNTLILISGALLIVLAAIVFLLSTWNTTPAMIKVGVLVVLIGVFLGSSTLADKKYNLEQTSKAFFYIAMAYIPLVLFSISIFKLLGEYLSIFGEGKFIYLAVSSIFLTLLYMFESGKRDNKGLLAASMFFEALASFFIVLIFTTEIKVVVSIASIILAVLYFLQSYKFNDDVISVISMAFQLLGVVFSILIFTEDIFTIIFGILIYNIVLSLAIKSVNLKQFSNLYSEFNKSLFLVLTPTIIIANLYGWITNSCTVIGIVNLALLLIDFILQGFKLKEFGYILNLTILSLILSVISLEGMSLLFEMKLLIMSIAVIVLYTINYILFKNSNHKIIAYISFNFTLLAILQLIGKIEYYKFVPVVSTIIEMIIELASRDNKDTKYYIIVSFVVAFVTLNIEVTLASFICLLINIVAFLYFTKIKEVNELVNAFPMMAIIPSVYFSDLFVNLGLGIDLRLVLSFILILYTTVKSIIKKEPGLDMAFSIVYIVCTIAVFKLNVYSSSIIVMLWSLAHAFTYEKNAIFKVVTYISGLVIYNSLITDLNIDQLTLTKLIGYLICLYLITRTVIKPADDAYKPIEYIGTSIIYIGALFMYNDISDAMIFIGMLLFMAMISFYNKIGPLFVVSIVAIVVNFFKLTKDFWYSIPWWVYLLSAGAILMAFAISNEASENNMKSKFKNVIDKIKDDIDA